MIETNGVISYGYANLHGDVSVKTDSNGLKVGNTTSYGPYGEVLTPVNQLLTGSTELGWVGAGGKGRLSEETSSIGFIHMGARPYVPGLGRFTEVDPVEGGSANDYDYSDGDPVSKYDLDGLWPTRPGWLPDCVAGKNSNGSCRGSSTFRISKHARKGNWCPLGGGAGRGCRGGKVWKHRAGTLKAAGLALGAAAIVASLMGASTATVLALGVSGGVLSVLGESLDPGPCRAGRVALAAVLFAVGGGAVSGALVAGKMAGAALVADATMLIAPTFIPWAC